MWYKTAQHSFTITMCLLPPSIPTPFYHRGNWRRVGNGWVGNKGEAKIGVTSGCTNRHASFSNISDSRQKSETKWLTFNFINLAIDGTNVHFSKYFLLTLFVSISSCFMNWIHNIMIYNTWLVIVIC